MPKTCSISNLEMPHLPVTFLHHPVAYFIYKIYSRYSLLGLIAGSMFPDLENPFIMLLSGTQVPNRMGLLSILGSVTIGTFLAVIVTVCVYPVLVSRIFRVDKKRLESKCKLSFSLVFSVLVGNLSHVLLDVTNHPYNPLFWPFIPTTATPSPLYFALGAPLGPYGCKSSWQHLLLG